MKKKDIRIIMSDIDGTLLTSEGKASPKTIHEIKRVKADKNILFGLATGRAVESVETCLNKWGLNGLVDIIMGMNGIHVKDSILQKETISHLLDGDYIREVMDLYSHMNVNFTIIDEGIFKTYKDDTLIRKLSDVDQIPYEVVDFDELLKKPHNKLIILCEEEDMPSVQKRSDEIKSEHYYGIQTGHILFEFMDPRISKGASLRKVMAAHGLTMDNLLTFGDANNDYEMTRDSGLGVAMENGSILTKQVADVITNDNDHDGIGNFLESYFQ